MEKKELLKNMEKPHFKTIEEVFDNSDLTEDEKNIFKRYEKYCKYWLLRIKADLLKSSYQHEDSFLKKIAICLIKLHSENVFGSKKIFVKEMFGNKKVHRVYKTANGGVRSTINSNIISNKYFELDILSYFIDNDFQIYLAESKEIGQKIPEFKALKNNISINVEAKRLDQEKIMDNIFGDRMTFGIDYNFSKEEIDKGLKRIKEQFYRNFNSALIKMNSVPNDEYFLVFIYVYYRLDFTGKYLIDYLNNITKELTKYKNLVGLVIPDSEKTYYFKNPLCQIEIEDMLNNYSLDYYHSYKPGQNDKI